MLTAKAKLLKMVSLGMLLPAVGVVAPVVLSILVLRNALNIPVGDEWWWAILVYQDHVTGLHFADLWAQHNEHRIVFPTLLMLLLERFGGYNVVREITMNLAIATCTLGALTTLINRTLSGVVAGVCFVAISLLVCAMTQYENWIWGFQMAWFLVNLCAVLVALLLMRGKSSWWSFWFAAGAAVVASFSVSSGLDIWISGLLILVAIKQPQRLLQSVVWAVLACICFALYLHGYEKPPAHPSPLALVHDPLGFTLYLLTYVGAPLALARNPLGILPAGLLIVGCSLFVSIDVFRARRTDRERFEAAIPWLSLVLFATLAAVMTAIGRFGFGVDQAFSSRYVTVSTLFWIGTIGAAGTAVGDARRFWDTRRHRVLTTVLASFLLISYGKANYTALRIQHADKDHRLAAFTALQDLDDADDRSLEYTFPDPNAERKWAALLQEVHDGPFGSLTTTR